MYCLICLLCTFLCFFLFVFLTHLCGSISGNTSFTYLLDSSPMKRKIVFFFIIWTINTVSIETLSMTVVTRLALRLSNQYDMGGSGMAQIAMLSWFISFRLFSDIFSTFLPVLSPVNYQYLISLSLSISVVYLLYYFLCHMIVICSLSLFIIQVIPLHFLFKVVTVYSTFTVNSMYGFG